MPEDAGALATVRTYLNRHLTRARLQRAGLGLVVATSVGLLLLMVAVTLTPMPEPQAPETTRILDHRGQEVTRLFVQDRQSVPLAEIPLSLQEAVLAMEDTRFERHFGVDPIAIVRALRENLRQGRVVAGGSTITQQLAKNLFLSPDRTLQRKLRELFITLKLESRFSKDEILELYLNQIYLGHGAYGVEVAAQNYFAKSVRHLTLAESAMLAGLVNRPEAYSPFRDPQLALERRDLALDRMVELGVLSPAQRNMAAGEAMELADPPAASRVAAHFADYVLNKIVENHPGVSREDLAGGGYAIHTTLDRQMQLAAEKALETSLAPLGDTLDDRGVVQPQAALVALDPENGHVRAMVGGRDYERSTLNRVFSRRQPGSLLKPFLYAAALDQGATLLSQKDDEYVRFPDGRGGFYEPSNRGTHPYLERAVTIREALVLSRNSPAAQWSAELGPTRIIQNARRMGITEARLEPTVDVVLGSYEVSLMELTKAYTPLANLGVRHEPKALLRVLDPSGRTLVDFQRQEAGSQVLEPAIAYLITDALRDVLHWGTAQAAGRHITRPAAGKTGTTGNARGNLEAWFVGYTPDLVAGVLVAHDAREPVPGTGGGLAAPIWAQFMEAALEGSEPRDWQQPGGIVEVTVCRTSGLIPEHPQPELDELFMRGTEPDDPCPEPPDEAGPDDGDRPWWHDLLPDLLPGDETDSNDGGAGDGAGDAQETSEGAEEDG